MQFRSHLPVIFTLFFPFVSAGAYSVYLKPLALLDGPDARLRDIAEIKGEKTPGAISGKLLVKNLKAPFHVSRADLMKQLAAGPETLEGVYGSGIWILPLTERMTGKGLVSYLRDEFRRMEGAPGEFDAIEIRPATGAEVRNCPKCHVTLRLPRKLSQIVGGQRILSIDIRSPDGKKILHRQKIQVAVLKKTRLPVAKRDLSIGMRLSPDDFSYETRIIDPDAVAYATGRILKREVLFPIKKGAILTQSAVQSLPPIRKGQFLDAVYQSELVVIKCRAVALADGEIGDRIDVKLLLPSGKRSDNKKVRIVSDGIAVLDAR